MYSRNRYCRQDDGYELSPEEEELCCYELPPRYDGNIFSHRCPARKGDKVDKVDKAQLSEKEAFAECGYPSHNTEKEELSLEVSDLKGTGKCTEKEGTLRLLDGIGGEELLLIALILTVAGSDEGGEVLLFLVLLLICA